MTIQSVSQALSEKLKRCNTGVHALTSLEDAEHTTYVGVLRMRLRDALRRRRETGEAPLRLALVVECLDPSATREELSRLGSRDRSALEADLARELAGCLRVPESHLRLVALTPSATSSGRPAFLVTLELRIVEAHGATHLRQLGFARHRRVEALAAALELPAPPSAADARRGGDAARLDAQHGARHDAQPPAAEASPSLAPSRAATALSARLAAGKLTRHIDRPYGLHAQQDAEHARDDAQHAPHGAGGAEPPKPLLQRVVVVGAHSELRELGLSAAEWKALVLELAQPECSEAATAALAAPEGTVAALAAALRGDKAVSIAEVFLRFAEYFKVFAAYTSGLDAARSRIDAIRKLETGREVLQQCQQDSRTRGSDIHDWLVRPNQHIMRQPMLLEQVSAISPTLTRSPMTSHDLPRSPMISHDLP